MIDLTDLQRSSRDLRERFDLDELRVDAVMRKLFEEVYELSKEVGDNEFYPNEKSVAEEMADVFVMLIQLADSVDLTDEMLQRAIDQTIRKNDAKTGLTHEVVKGIITRKS